MREWTFGPADGVPEAIAPYVHAKEAGGLLAVTGQMPLDPATGRLAAGGVGPQTDRVMANLFRILELCGREPVAVLHARAYLVEMAHFDEFNAAYEPWWEGRLPARTCVAVAALAVGALVEIDLLVGA